MSFNPEDAEKVLTKFISALSQPDLEGEFDRLTAKANKQAGEIAKLHAENADLKAAITRKDALLDERAKTIEETEKARNALQKVAQDRQRQYWDEHQPTNLRDELHEAHMAYDLKRANKGLRETIVRKDEAMEKISKNNAELRKRVEEERETATYFRRGVVRLREFRDEVRRAVDEYDNAHG